MNRRTLTDSSTGVDLHDENNQPNLVGCSLSIVFVSDASGKIIKDIPFPIPLSVICSPSHMMKAVPAVSVTMVDKRNCQPG